jgi:NADPH2:quinone reductase
MLARPSVMAHMNEADAYHGSAQRVLAAMTAGVLQVNGTAYSLRDAARAQADLEAGRTTGALYLRP